MNIGLAISGNLTGFSRFYANEEAKNLLNTTKLNFDVHNLVSFLNNGEKLYAIFFSKDIIAVSLITNILDSFRRPGNLVVTVLIPRGYKIVDNTQTQKDSIYHLLNEINDKFYERNYLNGMVNQNPAVLMQDYYSEILSKYRLEIDSSQRKINTIIDITTPNKKTGYISAHEHSIPLYLSSLYRKSYEGYHHIFFASNAPQNIDEPAEEVVTYRVKVKEGRYIVPGEVRLTNLIPNVSPEQGEIDIPNKNFTYKQVLSGEAGKDIAATFEDGDTILLEYHFQEEKKTVYFKFYDGADKIDSYILRPRIVESNGSSYPLSTDSWTFKGKEIYSRKTIICDNKKYTIENSTLDLSRVRNEDSIRMYVQRGWMWIFAPIDEITRLPVNFKPVDITLINKTTGDKISRHVTGPISEMMSGNEHDWEMRIDSAYYKSVNTTPNGGYRLIPKPTSQPSNGDGGRLRTEDIQGGGMSIRSHETYGQQIKPSSGEKGIAKDAEQIRREKNEKYKTCAFLGIVAFLLVFGGIWGYKALLGNSKLDNNGDKDSQEEIVDNDLEENVKNVTFKFIDSEGDELASHIINKLDITFDPSKIININPDSSSYAIKFHPEANPSEKLKVIVTFQGINMLATDYTDSLEIANMNDSEDVRLSVNGSDIKLFEILSNKVSQNDFDSYSKKVQAVIARNEDYGMLLAKKLAPYKPAITPTVTTTTEPTKTETSPETHTTDDGIVNKEFDQDYLTLEKLNKMSASTNAEKKRKERLKFVLGSIKNGKCPKSADGLSSEQRVTVLALIRLNEKITNLPNKTDKEKRYKENLSRQFSNALQTNQFGKISKEKDKEISINTARTALRIRF